MFFKSFFRKMCERHAWKKLEKAIIRDKSTWHHLRYGSERFDRSNLSDKDNKEKEMLEALLHVFFYLPKGLFYMEPDYLRTVVVRDFNILSPSEENIPGDVSDEKVRLIVTQKAQKYYENKNDLLLLLGDAFVAGLKIRSLEYPDRSSPGPEPLKKFRQSTQGFAEFLNAKKEALNIKDPSWIDLCNDVRKLASNLSTEEICVAVKSFNKFYRFQSENQISLSSNIDDVSKEVMEQIDLWSNSGNRRIRVMKECLGEIYKQRRRNPIFPMSTSQRKDNYIM